MRSAWGVGMVQDKRNRERCRSWTVLRAQCTSVYQNYSNSKVVRFYGRPM